MHTTHWIYGRTEVSIKVPHIQYDFFISIVKPCKVCKHGHASQIIFRKKYSRQYGYYAHVLSKIHRNELNQFCLSNGARS